MKKNHLRLIHIFHTDPGNKEQKNIQAPREEREVINQLAFQKMTTPKTSIIETNQGQLLHPFIFYRVSLGYHNS